MEKAAQRILNAARKENIGISWIQRTYEGEEHFSLEFYNGISGIAYSLFNTSSLPDGTDYRNHADQGDAVSSEA